jgi:lipopolysaccharide transport system ATP-binding protein
MPHTAIRVEGLGKRYRLGEGALPYQTLREQIVRAAVQPVRRLGAVLRGGSTFTSRETFWALRDVSFEVSEGEVLGVVGRNGAGKTTLLKLLSRITEPTAGRAEIAGRVGSLLEVGTGFHPELTGRENVFLNGAILGMKRAETRAKFDRIVEFAEIARFIDTPVKFYSSGMYVRLAFSVAAHLEPHVLLIDEVLAVGDAGFQRKCIASIRDTTRGGRTALVVSHNMALVRSLCSRALLLEDGRLVADGPVEDVIDAYLGSVDGAETGYVAPEEKRRGAFVAAVRLLDDRGRAATEVPCGRGLRVEIDVGREGGEAIRRPWIAVRISSSRGELIAHVANREAGFELPPLDGPATVTCDLPDVNLSPGRYLLGVRLSDADRRTHDEVEHALAFTLSEADVFGTGFVIRDGLGVALLKSRWTSREAGSTALTAGRSAVGARTS